VERNLIILGIGIAIGYFIFRKKLQSQMEVIQPGDKSKDIEGMQKFFEKFASLKFDDYGVYDSDTQASVQYLLKGTNALKDNKGSIDMNFSKDLATIYTNSLTI
jgi:hypothetical protein